MTGLMTEKELWSLSRKEGCHEGRPVRASGSYFPVPQHELCRSGSPSRAEFTGETGWSVHGSLDAENSLGRRLDRFHRSNRPRRLDRRQGKTPEGVEDAHYRPGRVVFLSLVGLVLTVWGAVTLFT